MSDKKKLSSSFSFPRGKERSEVKTSRLTKELGLVSGGNREVGGESYNRLRVARVGFLVSDFGES